MKVLLISLGCDKNLVDSEVMLGLLNKAGHQLTNDETEADVVVVNTCAFISDAKEESINTIIEMGELKKTGKLKKTYRCGMSVPEIQGRDNEGASGDRCHYWCDQLR